jgi:uncharacterized protein (TIGR00369 family)
MIVQGKEPPPLLNLVGGKIDQVIEVIPHCRELGVHITEFARGEVVLALPYADRLVGDPDTGVIHGGAVTTLLDTACGLAVSFALESLRSHATLDLRIDYMHAAEPGKELFAYGHCYKLTKTVAFVRGVAFQADPDDPIGAASATFMLDSDGGRKPGANLEDKG